MRFRMAAALALLLLATARPAPVMAQSSSTNYKLGVAAGSGGLTTSTKYRLFSALPIDPAGRGTAAGNDVFVGYLRGLAFSPLDTVLYKTAAQKFEMFAFPLRRNSNSPTTVFNQFGGYNNTVWRLGHYDTATGKYLEPSSTGLTTIGNGLGYWLITKDAQSGIHDIGLPTAEVPFLGTPGNYVLANGPSAAPGWNQMGNPFQYPLQVGNIVVTDDSSYAGFVISAGNPLTDHSVKVWNDTTSAYEDASVLNGRQGFWIHKVSAISHVRLIFIGGSSTYGTPSPGLLVDVTDLGTIAGLFGERPLESAPTVSWSVSITARQGDRVAEPMVMGAAPVASGAWNPLCEALAPPPPGLELLTLRQTRSDWGRLSGDYTSVFQPPADDMSWDFTVTGAESPGEIALEVRSDDLPAGTRLWLTNRATGTRQELSPGGSITVPATAGPREYRVEAISGSALQPTANLSDGFLHVYPNPFRASAGLSFSLARGGDLSVDIFDLQGRRVRSLERRGLPAGEHVLVWDGRDASGNLAGSGVYLTRWHAGELSGTTRLVKID